MLWLTVLYHNILPQDSISYEFTYFVIMNKLYILTSPWGME